MFQTPSSKGQFGTWPFSNVLIFTALNFHNVPNLRKNEVAVSFLVF